MATQPGASLAGNVVLTGFMGTGKSTVGRALAEQLALEFVDTDQVIEANHGPIPVIFAEQVEAAFRSIEPDVARVIGDGTAHRPLLNGDDPAGRIRALLTERAAAYGQFEQVDTVKRSPTELAADIASRLAP